MRKPVIQLGLRGVALLGLIFVSTASAQQLTSKDHELLEKLVIAEAASEGHLGMALVARSVLNRTALLLAKKLSPGTYNARGRSLREVIYAYRQYQPVSDGSLERKRSRTQIARAKRAIALARDTKKLDSALRARGVGAESRQRLLSATGFRTKTAFKDSSQNYAKQTFRRHVFNGDKFSVKHDVSRVFEEVYSTPDKPKTTVATKPAAGANTVKNGEATRKSGEAPRKQDVRQAATKPAPKTLPASAQRDTTRYTGPARRTLAPGLGRGSHGAGVGRLQVALNGAGATPPLDVDGLFGPKTEAALASFQRANGLPVTGRLDAATLAALRGAKPSAPAPDAHEALHVTTGTPREAPPITLEQLRAIMPSLDVADAKERIHHLNSAMHESEIRTKLRQAAFLALLANDTAEMSVFKNPTDLRTKEGQILVGMGRKLGLDLEDEPELLAEKPHYGVRIVARFWVYMDGNKAADLDDFRYVLLSAEMFNGDVGDNKRQAYYETAKRVLGVGDHSDVCKQAQAKAKRLWGPSKLEPSRGLLDSGDLGVLVVLGSGSEPQRWLICGAEGGRYLLCDFRAKNHTVRALTRDEVYRTFTTISFLDLNATHQEAPTKQSSDPQRTPLTKAPTGTEPVREGTNPPPPPSKPTTKPTKKVKDPGILQ